MSEEKYNIDEYPIEEELEEVMKLNKEQVKIIEDLQQKVKQLEKENEYLKMSNPEQNMEHFRIINENKRKIDMLRKENHQLENIRKEAIVYIKDKMELTKECPQDLLNILNKGGISKYE